MKKTFYFGMLAAAAFAFASCQKEIAQEPVVNNEVTHVAKVTISKDTDTKTAVVEGANSASYVWTPGDYAYLNIYECYYTTSTDPDSGNEVQTKHMVKGTIDTDNTEYSSDYKSITLTVSFTGSPDGPYSYEAIYAKSVSSNHNPAIPSTQYPKADNFDPAADVLISKATADVTGVSSRLTELSFTMGRVVTVNKMTLTGLEAGEKVKTVEFSLDQHMAGTYTVSTGNYSSGGKKLTFDYTENGATEGVEVETGGEFPVYFTSAPVTAAGIESVVVTTDAHVYTKTKDLNPNPFDGKTITFAIGTMKRFNMAMGNYGEEITTGTVYTLVQADDDLYDGASYIIVGSDVDYAMGLYTGGNNHTAVAVTKSANAQNKSIVTIDNTITAEPVLLNQVGSNWTIKNNVSGNTYYGQYLVCATGNNNRLQETSSESSALKEWTISISSGVATIINTNTDATRTQLYYNQNGSSPMFACYAPGQTNSNYHSVALYVDLSTCVTLNDADLAYSVTSPIEVAWADKDSFVKPTLSNPHSLTVTYASSNEDVATVDASTGDVTFVGNGTTTISASSAKTSEYKAGYAEYQITVTGAPVAKGEGPENPFSAAEVVSFVKNLDNNDLPTDKEYYIFGTISGIAEGGEYGTQFGNATFFIGEGDDEFEAYRVLYVDNKKWTTNDPQIGIGDEVLICSRLTVYGETIETYAKTGTDAYNGYLVSHTKAPYFTAEVTESTIAYTGGSSIILNVRANVPWTAAIDNGATLKIGDNAAAASVSGTADTDVMVIIPENASGATYTISFSTTSDKVTAPTHIEIEQTDNSVQTKTYTLTISTSDFNSTSYAANNNEKTTVATCTTDNSKTVEVKWTSNQIMLQSSLMQWQKNNGYLYNSTDLGTIKSVTVNSSEGSFTTYYGTSSHPTSGTTVGNGYFTVKVGGATGKTSSVVVVFEK